MDDCPQLIFVDCSYNDLTTLTLSNQTYLQRLLCDHNQLTTLDVSFDQALTYINCRFNQLVDLRAIGCSSLRMVASQWNP